MLDLILTCLAIILWYVRPELGPWPLVLIVVGRFWRTFTAPSISWRRTCFDLPLVLFLISAAIASSYAFDQAAAFAKFWIITGGVALYDSLVFAPEETVLLGRRLSPIRGLLLVLPALIAAAYLLTSDWSSVMGKVPWLDSAMVWFSSWQPDSVGYVLDSNVAGGQIAALIPLQVTAASGTLLGWPLVALSFAGLLMSASRGAWLGLGVAGAGWLVWWLWGRRWGRRTWSLVGGLLVLALVIGVVLVLTWGPLLFPGGRPALLRNSIDLVLDTPFTGIGLGQANFEMPYSSYVLLLHVGYSIHSQNLLVQIWLEQGLLGLAAFLWILVNAVHARSVSLPWRVAALASLGVILVHGLVDIAFYGLRGVVVFFVPLAVIAREDLRAGPLPTPAHRTGLAAFALAAMAVLGLALLPPARAAFQANLGALAQTRAELSIYRWPEWPIQDVLRRSEVVDLAPAIARYRAALALDPANPTANRRLGQIELSRGEYEAARRHLEAAYAAASGQRATRQLLGESYAIAGDTSRAAALWADVDLGQGQLPLRTWWYEHIGDAEKAQRIQEAAAGLEP